MRQHSSDLGAKVTLRDDYKNRSEQQNQILRKSAMRLLGCGTTTRKRIEKKCSSSILQGDDGLHPDWHLTFKILRAI